MAKKRKGEAPAVETPAEDGKSKGKGRGMLVPAVLVTLGLLGGGAFAGGVFSGGDQADAAAPEPAPTEVFTPLGTITELESVTVNLADRAYAKVGLAIEFGPDVAEQPPTAPVLDRLIAMVGRLESAQLDTTDERETAKDELLASLQELYGDAIVALYYTEFVMQGIGG